MKRRTFLKCLGAGAFTIAVPASIIERLGEHTPGGEIPVTSAPVEITVEQFDFGNQLGIGYSVHDQTGNRYRHAVRINHWHQTKNDQAAMADVSKAAADGLGNWIKSRPELRNIWPPSSDQVLAAIQARFA